MKNHGMNPYLPSWEYVPDGEPHVFGKRVYIYGSHDRFAGYAFCQNDYVCWSAPVDDLTDWQYEGIIYTRAEAAHNEDDRQCLYAPDVTCGPDGRYYLYYALNETSAISVAVCDTPAGKYTYYGDVHYPDGTTLGARPGDEQQFDPGVLTEGETTWLYSGFCPPMMPGRTGALCYRLASDMLTVEQTYPAVVPGAQTAKGTGFEGHAFFEASSIRKIDGKYVFVYSSENNHELCYAVSEHPLSGYRYGGTLVDLGDLYMEDGTSDETRGTNYLGNTHGGMAELNGQWYIFYHRQTNQHSYSRQACAEPLKRTSDGGFQQAEVTSCGLNGGPLDGIGEYEARIACNLWSKHGVVRYDKRFNKKEHPYFTQSGRDGDPAAVQYIANMRDGSVCGFKYFQMRGAKAIRCAVSGVCRGNIEVSDTPEFATLAASIPVEAGKTMMNVTAPFRMPDGVKALYFRFRGEGAMNFFTFELS